MSNRHDRQSAFSKIYDSAYWGAEHLSGMGSTVEATAPVRAVIERVVKEFGIRSVTDVACGDMAWMPIALDRLRDGGYPVDFTGCDIVPSLIEQHSARFPELRFQQLDFVSEPIPSADLIICREALQHLPVEDILGALENFSASGARFLLTTIHLRRYGIRNHLSMKIGRCRDRNLMLPPFDLPNPVVIYPDTDEQRDKFIGLWALPFAGWRRGKRTPV
jgi:2-polyprenyl-3-methyl-5-hydroxy-6-metoxy-1,4-benzoquinol methylase